jgi:Flp pilus assembly pilin Flp
MHRVTALAASALRAARDERGQTMAEYAVLLGIISVGLLLALTTIGLTVDGFFLSFSNGI